MTLEVAMPGVDGLETLKQVRARRPDLPVIMLSSQGGAGTIVQAMRLGAHNFIPKPFKVDELKQAFSEALAADSRS